MNWWLIIVAIVVILMVIALSIWFVVVFIAKNDAEAAWFPKTVVVLALSLACCLVLLLPFDVATRVDPTVRRSAAGIDTELMWEIILCMVAAFALGIVPFALFYYEAYDPEHNSIVQQITPAATYTFVLGSAFWILCALLWWGAGTAAIPYYSYQSEPQWLGPESGNLVYVQRKSIQTLPISVSLIVYMVALFCLFGWVLFMVYGGVGLTALPVDILTDFMNRPKAMSASEYASERDRIAGKAEMMLKRAKVLREELSKKNKSSIRSKINAMKAETVLLEEEFERIDIGYNEQGGSPFKVALMLFVGIGGAILSLLWIIHIFMYNLTKVNPFINTFLVQLDDAFSLLGVLAYSVFAFYLLWCTIKGCVKVGMRLVFFTIHPMKLGDTLLNAMLFNANLILISSITVLQFCGQSFRMYASNTAIDVLLNLYVRNLKGIGTIVFYMQFIFIGIALLSVFWVILCPRKQVVEEEDKKDDD